MYLLDLVYPETEELLEIEKGELATSVYGLPVYFRVRGADDADAFHDGAAHAIQISIRYLDVGTDAIVLAYSTDGSTETTQTLVTKGDTGKWKWKHKTITSNARFDHSVYLNFDYADFALTCDSELLLSNVTLRETALNTEAVWKAAEERVTATAGEAAIDTTLFSGWTVSATYLARDTGSDSTSAGLAPDDYPFYAGATYANRASAPFRVTPAGALVATSATITGAITATSGTIGGFSVGSDYVRDAANSFGLASTVTGGDDVRFWAGAAFASRASAPFRVTEAGAATASSIDLAGGSVTGTFTVSGTLRNAASPNARYELTGAGLKGYDSGNVQRYQILNDGSGWLGSSSVFSWTTAGVVSLNGSAVVGNSLDAGKVSFYAPTLSGLTFTNNSPVAGYVAWSSFTLTYQGTTYTVSAGNSNAKYIYWKKSVSTTVLQAGASIPSNAADQFMVCVNFSGTAYPSNFAPFIYADYISVANLAAINADLGNITAGTITGATVRTDSSGARTEMNASNLFGLGFGGIGGIDGSAVVQWYAKNSDGKLYASGGNMALDVNGISVVTPTAYDVTRSMKFVSALGGTNYSEFYAYHNSGTAQNIAGLRTNSIASRDSTLNLQSSAPATRQAELTLQAVGNASNIVGFYMRSNSLDSLISTYGHLLWSADNTHDIGASANRPRDLYLSRAIVSDTTTGIKIATGTTQKIGFYNATPVARPSAYTQTYSTADKTHANPTANAITDHTGGNAATTTFAAITAGAAYAQLDMQRARDDLAGIASQLNKLRTDHLDLAQLVNAVIDDLQAIGLFA